MNPISVVEDFYVLKNELADLRSRHAGLEIELLLQSAEEGFGDRIVPAVALAAHALSELAPPEQASKLLASVLNAAVGVDQRPRSWASV